MQTGQRIFFTICLLHRDPSEEPLLLWDLFHTHVRAPADCVQCGHTIAIHPMIPPIPPPTCHCVCRRFLQQRLWQLLVDAVRPVSARTHGPVEGPAFVTGQEDVLDPWGWLIWQTIVFIARPSRQVCHLV
jgi:hypothetical protein